MSIPFNVLRNRRKWKRHTEKFSSLSLLSRKQRTKMRIQRTMPTLPFFKNPLNFSALLERTAHLDNGKTRWHDYGDHLMKLSFRYSRPPTPSFPQVCSGNPEHQCSWAMEPSRLTSQTTAGFKRINDLGYPLK